MLASTINPGTGFSLLYGYKVTARWYGDADLFTARFAHALEQRMRAEAKEV